MEGPTVYDSLGTNGDDYLKQSILLLGSYQLSSGFVTGCLAPQSPVHTGPPIPGTTACYSASYSMYFTPDLADYYRATGDLAFAQQEFPIVQRELGWNASQVNSQGLLVTDSSDGQDWDWYDATKTGAVTEYNALYYDNLIEGAYLARETGHSDLATQYTNQAAALRTAINTNLFNSHTGVYDLSAAGPWHRRPGRQRRRGPVRRRARQRRPRHPGQAEVHAVGHPRPAALLRQRLLHDGQPVRLRLRAGRPAGRRRHRRRDAADQ